MNRNREVLAKRGGLLSSASPFLRQDFLGRALELCSGCLAKWCQNCKLVILQSNDPFLVRFYNEVFRTAFVIYALFVCPHVKTREAQDGFLLNVVLESITKMSWAIWFL
jgi:hypothetical protein